MNTEKTEIKVGTRTESLADNVRQAREQVRNAEIKTRQEQEEAKSLELELREAQIAKEQREEAERQGKETAERINALNS